MEIGVGYPGYNTLIPQVKRGLGDILKHNGYNTAWFGKNHNVPDWHTSQAGPFDLWPTGLGLRVLLRLHRRRHQPVGAGDRREHEADRAAARRPQLQLRPRHGRQGHRLDPHAARRGARTSRSSPTTPPAPPTRRTTRPKEWIAKFKGKFDQGWDKQREMTYTSQKEMGIIPPNTQADRSVRRRDPRVGLAQRRREEGLRPHDGGLRRRPLACRSPDGPHHRRDRGDGRARQHAHHLHPGRQRRQRRGQSARACSTR